MTRVWWAAVDWLRDDPSGRLLGGVTFGLLLGAVLLLAVAAGFRGLAALLGSPLAWGTAVTAAMVAIVMVAVAIVAIVWPGKKR